jgi:hypothetical protein
MSERRPVHVLRLESIRAAMRLHHALALARQAVPVFPCVNAPTNPERDKKPLTKHGFHDASTNQQIIRHWWRRWPDALIAAPTGLRFVVLDVDLQHPEAREWFAAVELPETRTHFTRHGGRHFLFHPHLQVRNSEGTVWPHVDTRGRGGYIIWWPACGFEVQHSMQLAPEPDAIIEALKPPQPSHPRISTTPLQNPDSKLAGILRTIARAPEGQRNKLTYWGSCRIAEMVAAGALSESEALDLIIEAASRSGLPCAEAKRTAKSGLRRSA